jgi:hypothetical protein
MVARNREGIGLSYWPARLHRLTESIPWNRILTLGSLKFKNIVSVLQGSLLIILTLYPAKSMCYHRLLIRKNLRCQIF